MLVLASAMIVPAAAQTERARPVVLENETILRVEGEGLVKAAPSRMIIGIGVETVAPTAAEALDTNNRKLTPVIEALKAQGIPPSNIQSTNLEVSAEYSESRDRNEERITGFRASSEINVSTDDLKNAGALISLLFDAGANTIDGPNFLVAEEKEEDLKRLAEADALREARAQADAAADALGMRVNRTLLVSDGNVTFRGGSGYIVVTGSRIARTPIEPGDVIVRAEYNVEFTLVPR